jgi:hypothetical protein
VNTATLAEQNPMILARSRRQASFEIFDSICFVATVTAETCSTSLLRVQADIMGILSVVLFYSGSTPFAPVPCDPRQSITPHILIIVRNCRMVFPRGCFQCPATQPQKEIPT